MRESGKTGGTESPDRGVGAHSGHEQQPQERVVPGTFSAAEGYAVEGTGTRQGDPLAGVEADPGTASRTARAVEEAETGYAAEGEDARREYPISGAEAESGTASREARAAGDDAFARDTAPDGSPRPMD